MYTLKCASPETACVCARVYAPDRQTNWKNKLGYRMLCPFANNHDAVKQFAKAGPNTKVVLRNGGDQPGSSRSGDVVLKLNFKFDCRLHKASRSRERFERVYLQTGLSPRLDCRPLTRLDRPSPALLLRPSSALPSLLLRPGADGVRLDVEVVRCLGAGSMLLRRLFMTLGGRAARRAIGLSSLALMSPSSAIAA
jgi:hypothetical protein